MAVDKEFIWKNRCEDLNKDSALFGSEFLNNAEILDIKPKNTNDYEIIYKSGIIHQRSNKFSNYLLFIFIIICIPAHNDMMMNTSFVGAIIGTIIWYLILSFIASYICNLFCNELLKEYRIELRKEHQDNKKKIETRRDYTSSRNRQQKYDPDFDFDPSAFGRNNSQKSAAGNTETPYGVDKRHPDDAKLWAVVDSPSSSDQERMNALSMILKKQAKREGKKGTDLKR